jgi:hypothetical protein
MVVCLSPFAPRKVPCKERSLSRSERRHYIWSRDKGPKKIFDEKTGSYFGFVPRGKLLACGSSLPL